jgi:antitoxin (DNA-binding transcriptional repressor) of toxin-antitoxin stability system
MIHVDIQDLQSELPRYLEEVARGETMVVTRAGVPIAELRPLLGPPKAARVLGLGRGLGEVHPSFFEPLPDDVLGTFYGAES